MGETADIVGCMWTAETLHGIQGVEKHKKYRFGKNQCLTEG